MNAQHTNDYILYQQGREAMEKRDFSQAIDKLTKSAEGTPHFKTYESLGECLLEQNRYGEAVVYLAAAGDLGNKQFRPYFLLAKALLGLSDVEKAREKLNQALSINPDYKAARDLLATIEDAKVL